MFELLVRENKKINKLSKDFTGKKSFSQRSSELLEKKNNCRTLKTP